MNRTEWFKRTFPKIDDHGRLPTILERLKGTPHRLSKTIRDIDEQLGSAEVDGNWSIKKEIGHLIDLEPLWFGRVEDLINNQEELREADLTNQKTHITDHDSRDLKSLISEFTDLRNELILKICNLTQDEIERSALHPRLKTPMHIVDLAYFVAEHDDHHLSQMTYLKEQLSR